MLTVNEIDRIHIFTYPHLYSHTFTFTDSKVVKWSGFEALVSANISGNSIERFIRDIIDYHVSLSKNQISWTYFQTI